MIRFTVNSIGVVVIAFAVLANFCLSSGTNPRPQTHVAEADATRLRLANSVNLAESSLANKSQPQVLEYLDSLAESGHAPEAVLLAGKLAEKARLSGGSQYNQIWIDLALRQASAALAAGDYDQVQSLYERMESYDSTFPGSDQKQRLARDHANLGIVAYMRGMTSANPVVRKMRFEKAAQLYNQAETERGSNSSIADKLSLVQDRYALAQQSGDDQSRGALREQIKQLRAQMKVNVPTAGE